MSPSDDRRCCSRGESRETVSPLIYRLKRRSIPLLIPWTGAAASAVASVGSFSAGSVKRETQKGMEGCKEAGLSQ